MLNVLLVVSLCLHGAISQENQAVPCACNSKVKTRVLFGETAKVNEFPFLAYVEANIRKSKMGCTGAAISRNFILTAAHCLRKLNKWHNCMETVSPGQLTITMGSHFSNEKSQTSQTFKASKVFLHPGASEATFENDLALIQLEKNIEINDQSVSVGCLYYGPREKLENSPAIITGWGENLRKANNTALQKGDTRIKPFFECRKNKRLIESDVDPKEESYMTLSDNTICAVSDNALTTGGEGDSGGPLLVNMGGNLQIVAVVTSVEQKASQYGFFSLVSPAMNWIMETANATECQKQIPNARTPDAPKPILDENHRVCETSGTDIATAWKSSILITLIFIQRLDLY